MEHWTKVHFSKKKKKQTYIYYDKAYILVSVSKCKVFYISVTRILW